VHPLIRIVHDGQLGAVAGSFPQRPQRIEDVDPQWNLLVARRSAVKRFV
jgi:hypothetical protein